MRSRRLLRLHHADGDRRRYFDGMDRGVRILPRARPGRPALEDGRGPEVWTRAEAIGKLRHHLLRLTDEEHSICQVVSALGIFCRGFRRWHDNEFHRRWKEVLGCELPLDARADGRACQCLAARRADPARRRPGVRRPNFHARRLPRVERVLEGWGASAAASSTECSGFTRLRSTPAPVEA